MEALKERAEAVISDELLNSISGGTENACHDTPVSAPERPTQAQDGTAVRKKKIIIISK